ncbi:CUB domain-containing protein [Bacillus sp. IT-79MI2]
MKGLSPFYHLGGNHNEVFVLPYSNSGDSWRFELVVCCAGL